MVPGGNRIATCLGPKTKRRIIGYRPPLSSTGSTRPPTLGVVKTEKPEGRAWTVEEELNTRKASEHGPTRISKIGKDVWILKTSTSVHVGKCEFRWLWFFGRNSAVNATPAFPFDPSFYVMLPAATKMPPTAQPSNDPCNDTDDRNHCQYNHQCFYRPKARKAMLATTLSVYLSEIAPCNYCSALNVALQLNATVGMSIANSLTLYSTNERWLGLAIELRLSCHPCLSFTIVSLFLPSVPTSLIPSEKK
ncbi:hypothetical protein RJ639_046232 [Escallonia herrerae]|uniref:Uncharacterized protein n=1 Tax=Escallonia herrerae TaxID=1293975 RepID=A0AA88W8L7_9ASTE|nr:hypothetical protein RJ639_046232 [Escallonia herrerae]